MIFFSLAIVSRSKSKPISTQLWTKNQNKHKIPLMNPFWSNFEWNVYHSIASAEKLAQNQTASVVPWPSEFYLCDFCDMPSATQSAKICVGGCKRRVGVECRCGERARDQDDAVICQWCRARDATTTTPTPVSRGRVFGRLRLVLFVLEPQWSAGMWPFDVARRHTNVLRECAGLGSFVVFGRRCAPHQSAWRDALQLVRQFCDHPRRYLPPDCLIDDTQFSVVVQLATHCGDGADRGLVWGETFAQRKKLDWWLDQMDEALYCHNNRNRNNINENSDDNNNVNNNNVNNFNNNINNINININNNVNNNINTSQPSYIFVTACRALVNDTQSNVCRRFVERTGAKLAISCSDEPMFVELTHVQRLLRRIISPPPLPTTTSPTSELRLFVQQRDGRVLSAISSASAPIETPMSSEQEEAAKQTLMKQLCVAADAIESRQMEANKFGVERQSLKNKSKSECWPFQADKKRVKLMNVARYQELFRAAAVVRALSIDAAQLSDLIGSRLPSARNVSQYSRLLCDKLARSGVLDARQRNAGTRFASEHVSPRQLSLEYMIVWRLVKPPPMRVLLNLDVERFDKVFYALRRQWLAIYKQSLCAFSNSKDSVEQPNSYELRPAKRKRSCAWM